MRSLFFALLLASFSPLSAQDWMPQLHDAYEHYEEESLTNRRFKHQQIVELLNELPTDFAVTERGQSVQGRAIHTVTIGSGPTTVLLWTQMHGDEPTATAAMFDIFNFLMADDAEFASLRKTLLEELTIVTIPMLNPDGAERFQRRNAVGVDLNRDALRLTTPEARLLKQVRDELDADWGFNLHDQSRYYGAGYPTDGTATLSFLAPAYNFAKSVHQGRERAMQVIALMNEGLQAFIPGKVGRYNDAFEPRAFGDNMQKWGTSTILIESGGYVDDREKQYIRQLNFMSILAGMHAMATESYRNYSRLQYNQIPFNRGGVFNDLLLREVRYQHLDQDFLLDIAFDLDEHPYRADREFYLKGSIDDIGDLTYQRGYDELPASGYSVEIADIYPVVLPDLAAVAQMNPAVLYPEGFAVLQVKKLGPPWERASLPFLIVGEEGLYDKTIQHGKNPPLLIRDEEGSVIGAVVNGQLHLL